MVSATCVIDRQILVVDNTICNSIDALCAEQRGFLSQMILAQLRNFVEHIMLKTCAIDKLKLPDIEGFETYPSKAPSAMIIPPVFLLALGQGTVFKFSISLMRGIAREK